jgi:hypothetical protein
LKVAMEVFSIVAFLLGSPLYVQQFAEPSASDSPQRGESNPPAANTEITLD